MMTNGKTLPLGPAYVTTVDKGVKFFVLFCFVLLRQTFHVALADLELCVEHLASNSENMIHLNNCLRDSISTFYYRHD